MSSSDINVHNFFSAINIFIYKEQYIHIHSYLDVILSEVLYMGCNILMSHSFIYIFIIADRKD